MTAEMLKSIVELAKAVSWPLLVLILIVTQRKSITDLLSNLESLTLPGGIEAKIRRKVEKETKEILKEDPRARERPSERQVEASDRIQRLASSANLSVVREQMDDLAREYERVRATMPPGDGRTR